LFRDGHFNASVNRSYYAIFNSIRALLALDGVDFKKHSAVIAYFQKEYIKTGKIATAVSDYIRFAFRKRNDSDYLDFYSVSEDEARNQITDTEKVITEVCGYLATIRDSTRDLS
jgi:uncharacterized protein (UPF0332 family)